MQSLRIWVVDRTRLFRDALKSLLEGSQFHVTLDAPNMTALADSASEHDPPDLIVVTVHTELASGTEEEVALGQLCHRFSATPVVVLADTMSLGQLKLAMQAGASGYLLRDITPDALRQSLLLAAMGEKVLPTDLVKLLVTGGGLHTRVNETAVPIELSPREKDMLIGLAHGYPNKVIANQLHITEETVKVHIKALFRKIHVRNRTEAAIWALNHGFDTAG